MVARPSLKRVVPGSVPPWRALCAESAPALKACFSVLCVSKTILLLESKFVQILRALNSGRCARAWAAGAAGPPALAVARPRVVPGSFPFARACFSWPRRCSGLPQRFSWPRRGFPLPAIKKARSSSLRLIRSLSTFAVETLLALRGAELPTCGPCCNSAKRELEIIAKPLGLLHEALLSVSWLLVHRNLQLLSALATYYLPPANLSCSLLADFCSSSPTSSVALRARPLAALLSPRSMLSCAGVEADSW